MPLIPAVCDSCGTVWLPRAIDLGAGSSAMVRDTRVSPCPACGGEGHIEDGFYVGTKDAVRFVRDAGLTPSQLYSLLVALTSAASWQEVDEEQVAPEARPLLERIRESARDYKWWIPILIALVLWRWPRTEPMSDAEVNRIADAVVRQIAADRDVQHLPKQPRNAPCLCGSGQKWKYCALKTPQAPEHRLFFGPLPPLSSSVGEEGASDAGLDSEEGDRENTVEASDVDDGGDESGDGEGDLPGAGR